MTRSARLLALLEALRACRGPVTARELAVEFGLSERTLYRDLATLKAQGAAVEAAPGLGYVLRPGHFLPPLMLEAEEADAVALGLRFVQRRGDPALARAARRAAAKLAAVLPEDHERRIRLNGLVVAPSGGGTGAQLATVRAALDEERKLRLRYRDRAGVQTKRTVWPVALGFLEDAEVLAAWCEVRGAFRHFRLDRAEELRLLPDRLSRPRRALPAEWRATEPGVEL